MRLEENRCIFWHDGPEVITLVNKYSLQNNFIGVSLDFEMNFLVVEIPIDYFNAFLNKKIDLRSTLEKSIHWCVTEYPTHEIPWFVCEFDHKESIPEDYLPTDYSVYNDSDHSTDSYTGMDKPKYLN